jgi:hypothetical protein
MVGHMLHPPVGPFLVASSRYQPHNVRMRLALLFLWTSIRQQPGSKIEAIFLVFAIVVC